jgi:hypothetical protein
MGCAAISRDLILKGVGSMKINGLYLLFIVLGLSLQGCGNSPVTPLPTESLIVQDQASLLAALQESNATAEIVDSVIQDFFSPEGNIIRVNGVDIQVFEYETSEAMEQEADQVAPDGDSVGTSMMMWMDAPHFYKTGQIIVLYIGSDEDTLNLLRKVIGDQFAGR